MKKLLSSTLVLLLLWSVGGTGPAQEYRSGGTGRAKAAAPATSSRPEGPRPPSPSSPCPLPATTPCVDRSTPWESLPAIPAWPPAWKAVVTLLTQGKGLAGLDKTRPWGAVVPVSGQDRTFDQLAASYYVFVPVTDLKQLAALLPDPANGKPLAPGADGV